MNGDKVKRYVALWCEEQELKERLALVTSQRDELARELRDEMLLDGTKNLRVERPDGGGDITVYVKNEVYVSPREEFKEDKVLLHDALVTAGLADLIKPTYSASALAAWVRECLAEQRELPDPIKERFNIIEESRVLARRSGASEKSITARAASAIRTSNNSKE